MTNHQHAGLLCSICLRSGTVRTAWTVLGGEALCIRHAIESTNADDMDQHNLLADIYESLRRQGFPDAY